MVNDRENLDLTAFAGPSGGPVEWLIADAPVPYPEAVAAMEARVAAIAAGEAPEPVWLLEHPPLYTAGTSAADADLLDPSVSRCSPPGAAASSPITAPASAWPMSCST